MIFVLVSEPALNSIACFLYFQVSKEFDGVVKQIRDSVQLLVLPPDLSPAALQGFVRASFLSRGCVLRTFTCLSCQKLRASK